MTAICFVCNLPILSHQVGLVWQGGNGWDDLVREQVEESTLRQRLGAGRRDSAAQITSISPPTEVQETSPPSTARRRRSSLAQLTDILRDWGGSKGARGSKSSQLCRRETLADLAKSLPWGRAATTDSSTAATVRKRRESSADQSLKSAKGRRDSTAISDLRSDLARLWSARRESTVIGTIITAREPSQRRSSGESARSGRRDSLTAGGSRRGSGESARSGRRDSLTAGATSSPPKLHHHHHHHHHHHRRRRDSRTAEPPSYYLQEQRPSTSSTASDSGPSAGREANHQALPPPTIVMSSTTPPATSPSGSAAMVVPVPAAGGSTCSTAAGSTAPHALASTRRDSTTQTQKQRDSIEPPHDEEAARQVHGRTMGSSTLGSHRQVSPVGRRRRTEDPTETSLGEVKLKIAGGSRAQQARVYYKARRDSSGKEPAPGKYPRLPRQATAVDDALPPGPWGRRGSQPTLSPDPEDTPGRKARRDSLSPDSARPRPSPDRDPSPSRRARRLRRQSTSIAGGYRGAPRSPESSSTCSSRDPSPCGRACAPPHAPAIRRQSTTEEILIARGFRRQSTTEEMIRCRNFRRQSSQSDETVRSRGRRDSSAQITDGTIASMTVETTSTFFDTSTQTEPSPLYDNNHYHEECLRCNSCGLNLTGPNQKRARRFKNQILCDLHFADVALMECSDFMQQLRSFKPQSLGCAVARRKSSTTLIFPLPPQACSDEFCEEFPHNLIPTPGYWIECSRQKITCDTIWDESESEHELNEEEEEEEEGGGARADTPPRAGRLEEDLCLLEDEEEEDLPRKKTAIEEQWEKHQGFELTSVEQETYEKYFYSTEHWNYFTNDEDLGPVILSIKQETINGRDQFRAVLQDPGACHQLHGARPDPGVLRVRRPLQPRGGGALSRQGGEHQPAADARPAARHPGGR
ncbi:uncharacterized protein LOC134532208 [Bacillus rossius redtenbacheri]|uniref:uncharacterized protein LOC134532208 n=1 Tax=Bacillus rossius redtenbacheri TaxID=93214 RepID=UPI002FDE1EB8